MDGLFTVHVRIVWSFGGRGEIGRRACFGVRGCRVRGFACPCCTISRVPSLRSYSVRSIMHSQDLPHVLMLRLGCGRRAGASLPAPSFRRVGPVRVTAQLHRRGDECPGIARTLYASLFASLQTAVPYPALAAELGSCHSGHSEARSAPGLISRSCGHICIVIRLQLWRDTVECKLKPADRFGST